MSQSKQMIVSNRQGKSFAVQVCGVENAPVVMFCNSLGTDHLMWQAQVEALQTEFKVVTYDTRGHGQSEVIADSTLQNLAEDVLDILDVLNIEQAHFCGISVGGLTALWLAVNQPTRFKSIIVANSAAKIWNEAGWNTRAAEVEQNGLSNLVASTHSRWFSEKFDYVHSALAQKAIESLANTPKQGYANACRVLATADLREDIASISIPTLLIAGLVDPVTTVADAEFMQQRISNSQMYIIDASHLSNIEKPQQFTQELRRFIHAVN